MSSLNWLYGTYTWPTNRDTYDKIIFDDVRSNVILTAILAYMASEDPAKTSREKLFYPLIAAPENRQNGLLKKRQQEKAA